MDGLLQGRLLPASAGIRCGTFSGCTGLRRVVAVEVWYADTRRVATSSGMDVGLLSFAARQVANTIPSQVVLGKAGKPRCGANVEELGLLSIAAGRCDLILAVMSWEEPRRWDF